MESSLLNDTSLSSSKQIKNTKRKNFHQIHHPQNYYQYQYQYQSAGLPNISRQSSYGNNIILHQKFAPQPPPPHVQLEMLHATTGSVFLNHLPNNNSINNQASLFSSLPPTLPSHHHNNHHQPPLLPLPLVPKPTFHSLPALTRNSSLSSPIPRKQTNKKTLKTPPPPTSKRSSTTHKKNINNKKENTNSNNNNDRAVGSTKGVGQESRNYPKEVNSVEGMEDLKKENGDKIDKFITPLSVFCLAPPPSSLPLPKFSLRQVQHNKISCKAEVAFDAVDAGAATAAADNLCRLLKLR